MKKEQTVVTIGWTAVLTAALSACSLIDEDLSACGDDYRMDYRLTLVTNMEAELNTELNLETDLQLRQTLKEHLSGIFTDRAHDVDLSFYDTEGDSLRKEHDRHIMDATEATYTLYLPVEEYMHLAVANLMGNKQVLLTADQRCPTSLLDQHSGIVVESHAMGIFTARQPMALKSGEDQTFHVSLYMANSAAALIVDTTGCQFRDMKVYIDDLADGFLLRDSVYLYRYCQSVVAQEVSTATRADGDDADDATACFVGVGFPSRDNPVSDGDYSSTYWRIRVYATLPDGTTTENILHVAEPLKAGNLKIVRCRMNRQGVIGTDDTQEVGVSVTLDWKEGNTYQPEI